MSEVKKYIYNHQNTKYIYCIVYLSLFKYLYIILEGTKHRNIRTKDNVFEHVRGDGREGVAMIMRQGFVKKEKK